MEVPREARLLFIQACFAKEMQFFFEGKTEVSDIYSIVLGYAKDDKTILCHCASAAAEKSNVLGKFMYSMLKLPFIPSPRASDYAPSCPAPRNNHLHDLACGRSLSLADHPAVGEFEKRLSSSHHISVSYHQNSLDEVISRGRRSTDF